MSTSSTTPLIAGTLTPCQVIEIKITAKNTQFNTMYGRLEVLLNDVNSDFSDIQTARNELTNINKELSGLRDDQRKQGCQSGGSSEVSKDTQTVIATSPTRRKDAKALEIVAMPTP